MPVRECDLNPVYKLDNPEPLVQALIRQNQTRLYFEQTCQPAPIYWGVPRLILRHLKIQIRLLILFEA